MCTFTDGRLGDLSFTWVPENIIANLLLIKSYQNLFKLEVGVHLFKQIISSLKQASVFRICTTQPVSKSVDITVMYPDKNAILYSSDRLMATHKRNVTPLKLMTVLSISFMEMGTGTMSGSPP